MMPIYGPEGEEDQSWDGVDCCVVAGVSDAEVVFVVGVVVVAVVGSLVTREVTVPLVLGVAVGVGVGALVDVVFVVVVLTVVVEGTTCGTSLSVMRMSAQARNCSWGPQPLCPVPLGHIPQLLPAM